MKWLELTIAGMCLLSFVLGYAAACLCRTSADDGPPFRNPGPTLRRPPAPPPAPPRKPESRMRVVLVDDRCMVDEALE